MNYLKIFEEDALYKIKDHLFNTAKSTYESNIGIDCDLQLVQRRKENSKSFSMDISERYTYITDLSEYFS